MKRICIVALTFLVMACNSNSTASNKPADKPQKKEKAAAAVANDGKGATDFSVTLKGSAIDGTYSAHANEPTCSLGLAGENSFGNQYSETDKSEKELSNVQLVVKDYEEGKKGTDHFSVQFGFGQLFKGPTFDINPAKNMGKGKATISESGGDKIVTIEGTTDKGVKIAAVITCHHILHLVNGSLETE